MKDVFSDDRFPQFNYSQKHADNIYAYFNNTDAGYHSSYDTELIIKNLSNTSSIRIWCIDVEGAEIELIYNRNLVLNVGESVTIGVNSVSSENAEKPFKVIVKYTIDNDMHTTAFKAFSFISLSDEDIKQYTHLAKNKADDPIPEEPMPPQKDEPTIETPQEPETEITTQPETSTKPETNSPTTDVEVPNTDSNVMIWSLPFVAICFISLMCIIRLRKKETEISQDIT